MQFGVITIIMKVAEVIEITGGWIYWFTWLMVICIPSAFYMFFRKTKIVKILF